MIRLIRCRPVLWESFRAYHYDPNSFNSCARCYLVEMGGKRVGFVAALAMASGTLKGAWRAHKTVVRLPASDPYQKTLWAMVADAQAQHHAKEGHRFYSVAPIEFAAYRENSGCWKATCKNERRKLAGYCSHEYIGERQGDTSPVEANSPQREMGRARDEAADLTALELLGQEAKKRQLSGKTYPMANSPQGIRAQLVKALE